MLSLLLLLSCSISLSSCCLCLPKPTPPCTCGVKKVSPTWIVGGQMVRWSEFPWQAAAQTNDSQKWWPTQGRNTTQYQSMLAEVAEQTSPRLAKMNTPWEFKKGSKSFAEICGLENPNRVGHGRIVGGNTVKEHQWPWQVALVINDVGFCGGSLISNEWVMTAAHCFDGQGPKVLVAAGAHNVGVAEEHRVEITSYERMVHPNYDPNILSNDIALVKLPEKILFNEFIRPACLPPKSDSDETYVGQLTTPVGWGWSSDDATGITLDLNMVSDLPVITNACCQACFNIPINDDIMCIDTSGGKGVCKGDSGGTLNIRQEADNKWTQVGVTSFVPVTSTGSTSCESGIPHGFSRVAKHLEWIETVTGLSLV